MGVPEAEARVLAHMVGSLTEEVKALRGDLQSYREDMGNRDTAAQLRDQALASAITAQGQMLQQATVSLVKVGNLADKFASVSPLIKLVGILATALVLLALGEQGASILKSFGIVH